MAAGIAHEIRNPLASISGSIQILREEIPLSAEQERLMDIVMRESDRLNNTIRAFLDYARPQDIPVIVITGLTATRDRDASFAAGSDAYLSKPVSPRRLLEEVRRFIPQ